MEQVVIFTALAVTADAGKLYMDDGGKKRIGWKSVRNYILGLPSRGAMHCLLYGLVIQSAAFIAVAVHNVLLPHRA